MISSRTPEGRPNRCPVCGNDVRVDPSTVPVADGPCPHCGTLLQFGAARVVRLRVSDQGSADFFARLDAAVAAGPVRIELDCADVDFLPSVVLGQFITAQHKAQAAGGTIVFVNLRPAIREVFEITKLDKLFAVE